MSQPTPPEPDDEDEAKPKKRRPIDAEMKSISDICAILDTYQNPAQARMLNYIIDRYIPDEPE